MSISAKGLKPASQLAADKPHGTRIKYMGGCRCVLCKRANSDYEKARLRARKSGDWNGIIDATECKLHIEFLSVLGVGTRVLSEVSDVPRSIIAEIKKGIRTGVRARTARAILAVGSDQLPDSHLVPAGETMRLIAELVEEGYTKSFLAKRMGYKNPGLQFNKGMVTLKTKRRVEKLHEELTK